MGTAKATSKAKARKAEVDESVKTSMEDSVQRLEAGEAINKLEKRIKKKDSELEAALEELRKELERTRKEAREIREMPIEAIARESKIPKNQQENQYRGG